MTNAKPEIIAALRGNFDLAALLGVDQDNNPRIYFQLSPYEEDYPRVTYFQLDNTTFLHADDFPIAAEISLQFDIWGRANPGPIADLVEKTMGGQYTGTVDVSGTAVTWVSGDHFNTAWAAGKRITLNGQDCFVASVTSATAMILQASAGALTGATYTADGLGFGRIGCHDLYEPETKTYHIALRMITRMQQF